MSHSARGGPPSRPESRTPTVRGRPARKPGYGRPTETCAPHLPDSGLSGGIRSHLRAEERLDGLVAIFKALADPVRIRVLFALRQGEVCVCDLAEAVECEVSSVSHHLRLLRTLRLVRPRREGKRVYYTLSDDHVRSLIDQGLEHVYA